MYQIILTFENRDDLQEALNLLNDADENGRFESAFNCEVRDNDMEMDSAENH